MITETHRKINFVSFSPGKKKKEETLMLIASVDVKYGGLKIPRTTCEELGMIGKLIRFSYEPERKIIGWQILKDSVGLEKLKSLKVCKISPAGTFHVSIRPMLNSMIGLETKTYGKLEIKKYIEKDLLEKGETYYYIQIKNGESEEN